MSACSWPRLVAGFDEGLERARRLQRERVISINCDTDSGAAAEARYADRPLREIEWRPWTVGGEHEGDGGIRYRIRGELYVPGGTHPDDVRKLEAWIPFTGEPYPVETDISRFHDPALLWGEWAHGAGSRPKVMAIIQRRLSACAVAWERNELRVGR